ncbi:MAG: hypothetical protein Q9210_001686 [Variospora velana]
MLDSDGSEATEPVLGSRLRETLTQSKSEHPKGRLELGLIVLVDTEFEGIKPVVEGPETDGDRVLDTIPVLEAALDSEPNVILTHSKSEQPNGCVAVGPVAVDVGLRGPGGRVIDKLTHARPVHPGLFAVVNTPVTGDDTDAVSGACVEPVVAELEAVRVDSGDGQPEPTHTLIQAIPVHEEAGEFELVVVAGTGRTVLEIHGVPDDGVELVKDTVQALPRPKHRLTQNTSVQVVEAGAREVVKEGGPVMVCVVIDGEGGEVIEVENPLEEAVLDKATAQPPPRLTQASTQRRLVQVEVGPAVAPVVVGPDVSELVAVVDKDVAPSSRVDRVVVPGDSVAEIDRLVTVDVGDPLQFGPMQRLRHASPEQEDADGVETESPVVVTADVVERLFVGRSEVVLKLLVLELPVTDTVTAVDVPELGVDDGHPEPTQRDTQIKPSQEVVRLVPPLVREESDAAEVAEVAEVVELVLRISAGLAEAPEAAVVLPAPAQRVVHSEPEQDVVSDDDKPELVDDGVPGTDEPPGVVVELPNVVELVLGASSEAEEAATVGWLDADAEDRRLEVVEIVREVLDVRSETALEVLDELHPKPLHEVDPDEVLPVPVSVVAVDWLDDRDEAPVERMDVCEPAVVELDDWTEELVVNVEEICNVDEMEVELEMVELEMVEDEADEIEVAEVVGEAEVGEEADGVGVGSRVEDSGL